MLRFVVISLIQSALLALGQVFAKLAAARMDAFSWTWAWFAGQLRNYYLAAAGALLIAATVCWFYILRHFPFSIAYPMTSVAYVFGMLAAVVLFKEPVPLQRWIGLFLIVSGVCLLVKP